MYGAAQTAWATRAILQVESGVPHLCSPFASLLPPPEVMGSARTHLRPTRTETLCEWVFFVFMPAQIPVRALTPSSKLHKLCGFRCGGVESNAIRSARSRNTGKAGQKELG